MLTGRLLNIDMRVTALLEIMLSSTAEPTKPVAPVRMRCMMGILAKYLSGKDER